MSNEFEIPKEIESLMTDKQILAIGRHDSPPIRRLVSETPPQNLTERSHKCATKAVLITHSEQVILTSISVRTLVQKLIDAETKNL